MKIAEKCENFSSARPQTPDFSRSVCLFDSGIGGLNVLFACRRILPDEKFVYYGDNERAPYGNLPEEAVKAYVYEAAETLTEYRPKALVLACNTATAHCARALHSMYPFPIIGSYPPLLSAGKHGGEGLVLVTRSTYSSEFFASLLRRARTLYPAVRFLPYPCDDLAAIIEDTNGRGSAKLYTSGLPARKFSFVVLGCTHYAYVKKAIADFYGCPVYDGNERTARRLACILASRRVKSGEDKADNGGTEKSAYCVTIPDHNVDFSEENISSDGKVLFVGSGKRKNKDFYEHSFVDTLS